MNIQHFKPKINLDIPFTAKYSGGLYQDGVKKKELFALEDLEQGNWTLKHENVDDNYLPLEPGVYDSITIGGNLVGEEIEPIANRTDKQYLESNVYNNNERFNSAAYCNGFVAVAMIYGEGRPPQCQFAINNPGKRLFPLPRKQAGQDSQLIASDSNYFYWLGGAQRQDQDSQHRTFFIFRTTAEENPVVVSFTNGKDIQTQGVKLAGCLDTDISVNYDYLYDFDVQKTGQFIYISFEDDINGKQISVYDKSCNVIGTMAIPNLTLFSISLDSQSVYGVVNGDGSATINKYVIENNGLWGNVLSSIAVDYNPLSISALWDGSGFIVTSPAGVKEMYSNGKKSTIGVENWYYDHVAVDNYKFAFKDAQYGFADTFTFTHPNGFGVYDTMLYRLQLYNLQGVYQDWAGSLTGGLATHLEVNEQNDLWNRYACWDRQTRQPKYLYGFDLDIEYRKGYRFNGVSFPTIKNGIYVGWIMAEINGYFEETLLTTTGFVKTGKTEPRGSTLEKDLSIKRLINNNNIGKEPKQAYTLLHEQFTGFDSQNFPQRSAPVQIPLPDLTINDAAPYDDIIASNLVADNGCYILYNTRKDAIELPSYTSSIATGPHVQGVKDGKVVWSCMPGTWDKLNNNHPKDKGFFNNGNEINNANGNLIVHGNLGFFCVPNEFYQSRQAIYCYIIDLQHGLLIDVLGANTGQIDPESKEYLEGNDPTADGNVLWSAIRKVDEDTYEWIRSGEQGAGMRVMRITGFASIQTFSQQVTITRTEGLTAEIFSSNNWDSCNKTEIKKVLSTVGTGESVRLTGFIKPKYREPTIFNFPDGAELMIGDELLANGDSFSFIDDVYPFLFECVGEYSIQWSSQNLVKETIPAQNLIPSFDFIDVANEINILEGIKRYYDRPFPFGLYGWSIYNLNDAEVIAKTGVASYTKQDAESIKFTIGGTGDVWIIRNLRLKVDVTQLVANFLFRYGGLAFTFNEQQPGFAFYDINETPVAKIEHRPEPSFNPSSLYINDTLYRQLTQAEQATGYGPFSLNFQRGMIGVSGANQNESVQTETLESPSFLGIVRYGSGPQNVTIKDFKITFPIQSIPTMPSFSFNGNLNLKGFGPAFKEECKPDGTPFDSKEAAHAEYPYRGIGRKRRVLNLTTGKIDVYEYAGITRQDNENIDNLAFSYSIGGTPT